MKYVVITSENTSKDKIQYLSVAMQEIHLFLQKTNREKSLQIYY